MKRLALLFIASALFAFAQAAPDITASAFVGQTATLTSTVGGGATPFAYQWQKNGVNIAGATNATLVISNLLMSLSATYTVVVTNSDGSATSNKCILNVTMPPRPPTGVVINAVISG